MPGKKSELQEKAKRLFMRTNGEITPREIGKKLGVSPETVRKWKYRGKWEEELKKPKRGAPRGNKNAEGHGAPEGNANAETHGAYSQPRIEKLKQEEKEEIEALTESFRGNAVSMLKKLWAKRADLERRLAELEELPEDKADLLDRSMTMTLPGGQEMKYTNKSAPFSRRMLLEAELNRVDGRIIKLLDSIKSQENEEKRLELERLRLEFAKQKATGIFNLGENGEVEKEDEEDEVVEE